VIEVVTAVVENLDVSSLYELGTWFDDGVHIWDAATRQLDQTITTRC
jgi:hypothetical protein